MGFFGQGCLTSEVQAQNERGALSVVCKCCESSCSNSWRRRELNYPVPFGFCNLLIIKGEKSAKRPTQASLSYSYRTIFGVENRLSFEHLATNSRTPHFDIRVGLRRINRSHSIWSFISHPSFERNPGTRRKPVGWEIASYDCGHRCRNKK